MGLFNRYRCAIKGINNLDLAFTILLTLLCMLFVLVPPLNDTNLRIVIALFFVIFMPGYSLVATLFPRRDDLDGIARVALSFGLSIVVVPLMGMVLNFTLFGIRLIPVLIFLSIFTILLSLIAWVRRMKLPVEERFRVSIDMLINFNLGQSFLDKVFSLLLIASIIGSSATLVYVMVIPNSGERFTEFYLLGPNGIASDYPTNMTFGEEGKVIIGIVNHEYKNFTYHLEVNFNGTLIHEEHILLIMNEKREISFTFKAIKKGENQKLEFILNKYENIENYRILHLWINVT